MNAQRSLWNSHFFRDTSPIALDTHEEDNRE